MKPCLILPAYNEAESIAQIIVQASAFIPDLIIVDDGSIDDTSEITRKTNLAITLQHEVNRGKGCALRTGFSYALDLGFDPILTMDTDGQHDPNDLPRFLEHSQNTNADIIIGGRVGDRSTMPLHRRLNNWLVSAVGSALCGQKVPDFQSGFRLIRAEVLRKISLTTDRYETESELLINAGRIGFRIETLPIRTVYSGEVSGVKPFREMYLFTRLLIRSLRENRE